MAARLQITVESASNLYNSDGVLAGKSDPYVIVEVPGQAGMKLQTEVISNELNPVWNFVGEISGFYDDDVLHFTVWDKDTFPKPDDFLGKAELTAQDFYPHGFHGELMLADSKTQATLTVMIVVTGCDAADPEVVEVEGVQTTAEAVLPSGIMMQGLQVYNPGVLTTTTTSQSMTYSAPQADSAPQTDSALQTDSAPQVPMNDMNTTTVVESQSITYEAPQAPMPSDSVATTGKVVVYPPVTVTAEEFAKLSGSILTEPLPVTAGLETAGVGTKREVDVDDSEVVDKTVKIKIKKRKSKKCC